MLLVSVNHYVSLIVVVRLLMFSEHRSQHLLLYLKENQLELLFILTLHMPIEYIVQVLVSVMPKRNRAQRKGEKRYNYSLEFEKKKNGVNRLRVSLKKMYLNSNIFQTA